ncbi:UPF0223 family protein [Macrococcus equipercicus]|uniref:UPF0223 family protein n=1 Tax=Macrococcus equipercicus TaxID=69967 RepID=A0A9Q9F3R3_9STAP|nr:UPF0223 family protein [Macrococcus equipercicus]UTH14534.1 UPF0223 family protein [Macrococcus equipercicus]
MEYSYPIDLSWSPEEMVDVVNFLSCIEEAYESKIDPALMNDRYQRFKHVVPGKAEENTIYKDFKKASGYDGYIVVKAMKEALKKDNPKSITIKQHHPKL